MGRARLRTGTAEVSLGEDVRVGHAREIVALLAKAAPEGELTLDASKVERVDAAGLQALVAGVARLRAAGVACRWREPSEKLVAAARLAGLAAALELA